MKKTVLTFGLIAGLLISGPYGRFTSHRKQDRLRPSMILGYAMRWRRSY